MPRAFQLLDRETKEPTAFNKIDEQICLEFSVPCDDKKYYMGWYDYVGLAACMGASDEKIIEEFKSRMDPNDDWDQKFLKVLEYILGRYTTMAWYEPRF
jgi:hypothetical protein